MITYEFKKTSITFVAAYAARALLEQLRSHTKLHTVGSCFPYGPKFPRPSEADEWLAANPGITKRCGNRNACPVCARAHEARMRKSFAYSFDHYIEEGWIPWWQTLEVGFDPKMEARDRYRALSRIWSQVMASRGIRRIREGLGAAYLRVTEETLVDGLWTPHFHVVWIFMAGVSNKEILEFFDEFSLRWRGLQALVLKSVENSRPLYYARLDTTTIPKMQYLFKSFRIEVTEQGMQVPGSMVRPIDFLIAAAGWGDLDCWDRWSAYQEASMGARRYKFSKNWIFVS